LFLQLQLAGGGRGFLAAFASSLGWSCCASRVKSRSRSSLRWRASRLEACRTAFLRMVQGAQESVRTWTGDLGMFICGMPAAILAVGHVRLLRIRVSGGEIVRDGRHEIRDSLSLLSAGCKITSRHVCCAQQVCVAAVRDYLHISDAVVVVKVVGDALDEARSCVSPRYRTMKPTERHDANHLCLNPTDIVYEHHSACPRARLTVHNAMTAWARACRPSSQTPQAI